MEFFPKDTELRPQPALDPSSSTKSAQGARPAGLSQGFLDSPHDQPSSLKSASVWGQRDDTHTTLLALFLWSSRM